MPRPRARHRVKLGIEEFGNIKGVLKDPGDLFLLNGAVLIKRLMVAFAVCALDGNVGAGAEVNTFGSVGAGAVSCVVIACAPCAGEFEWIFEVGTRGLFMTESLAVEALFGAFYKFAYIANLRFNRDSVMDEVVSHIHIGESDY